MKACRGVGASLTPEEITEWETEHRTLLEKIAPEESRKLRTAIEQDYLARFEMYKYLANQEPVVVAAEAKPAAGAPEGDGCTISTTAEHAGDAKAGSACDDGRAGK